MLPNLLTYINILSPHLEGWRFKSGDSVLHLWHRRSVGGALPAVDAGDGRREAPGYRGASRGIWKGSDSVSDTDFKSEKKTVGY